MRHLLETILPLKTTFDDYEVIHDFTNIGHHIMLLNARQIQLGTGNERIILLAVKDITERLEIDAGLEKTRKELAAARIAANLSREYAESIINTVREPLIVLDQDLRVVSVSPSFYEVFGVNPEETVGQLIYDLGNKQWDIPKLRNLLEAILPLKTSFDEYEVEHDFANIGHRVMLLNARQIQRGTDKERIILLVVKDITERKKIEAGLEIIRKELAAAKITTDAAREYAESIINTISVPLIVLNHDLRVLSVSPSFYKVFSVNPEETVGQLIYDLGNKQWDIPKLRNLLETILPLKTSFDDYEVEHDFANIGHRVMLLNARQIQQGLNKERIILLAIDDITKRWMIENGLIQSYKELTNLTVELEQTVVEKDAMTEQLNQTLQNTEKIRDRIDAILASVADGLVVTDNEARVVMMNPAAESLLGLRFSEIKGQPLHFVIEDRTLSDRMRVALEEREPGYQFDFEIPGDQPSRPFILRAKTARIGKNETKSINNDSTVIIIRDVSIERELDRLKTEFISTAAHELRTPLTSIQGFSEILITRDNLNPEKQKKYLSYINSQAVYLSKIIGDILDISRIESGRSFNLYKKDFNLNAIITQNIELFRSRCPLHEFEIHVPESPLIVSGDQEKLLQVMENLLSNAVKYSPSGGTIRITAQESDISERLNTGNNGSPPSTVIISIKDEGIGMTPDQVKRIYDKFWRADASNKAIEGTGLGMSIVKYIVEAHCGTVRVDSEPGKGTTVQIEIPKD